MQKDDPNNVGTPALKTTRDTGGLNKKTVVADKERERKDTNNR
ncbi:hypothetical protein [Borreliella valaisiana]